ncbi:glycerol kinase GlpK [Rickettsiales bacterium]|nr:glycerol kinase GlpK [Rickettsiales bacterium]
MNLIAVIDQGTTSSRVHLVNQDADILYTSAREVERIFPKDSYVEQDPEAIWESVINCLKNAFNYAESIGQKISACAITNQRESSLIWQRNNAKALYNVISWQDSRSTQICSKFNIDDKAYIRNKTGLILNPYFSGTKFQWLYDNVLKGLDVSKYAAGTIDSYLVYRLTKGECHYTDSSNISRTLLYDINSLDYDERLLNMFSVDHSLLPSVKNSMDDFGVIDSSFFGYEVPILSVIGDQQAATIGHCCFDVNQGKFTYGTGCFMMVNIGDKFKLVDDSLLTTILYSIDNKVVYAVEGSIFYAGSALNWARDNVGLFDNYENAEKTVANLEDNGGVYCVPALSGLGAPYWEDRARGVFVGLSNNTTKAHLLRSVFESIVYQTYDLYEILTKSSILLSDIKIDGGMANNSWFNQYLSDVLSLKVLKPKTTELTSIGAAYLAGLSSGVYDSFEQIKGTYKVEQEFEANVGFGNKRDVILDDWKRVVDSCLNLYRK